MTTLKDELKVKPGEGAVEYAERIKGVLERHERETGEKVSPYAVLDGEGPGEALERIRALNTADGIRRAGEARKRAEKPAEVSPDTKETSLASQKSSRSFRLKSQEQDVERAVADFEAAKKRLYRADGSKVYGEKEHAERLGRLRETFAERIGEIVSEAEEDAKEYERQAHSYTYMDPIKDLTSSERGRLDISRALVKEDSEDMAVPTLTERIAAVAAGSDRVVKVLHARYGRRRIEAIGAESGRLAREGRPVGAEAAREVRALEEAVSSLEEQLKDPKTEERRQAAKEAAEASGRLVRKARSRQSDVDGTAERARQQAEDMARAAF